MQRLSKNRTKMGKNMAFAVCYTHGKETVCPLPCVNTQQRSHASSAHAPGSSSVGQGYVLYRAFCVWTHGRGERFAVYFVYAHTAKENVLPCIFSMRTRHRGKVCRASCVWTHGTGESFAVRFSLRHTAKEKGLLCVFVHAHGTDLTTVTKRTSSSHFTMPCNVAIHTAKSFAVRFGNTHGKAPLPSRDLPCLFRRV